MPRVSFSPEGIRSLARLPREYRLRFNEAFTLLEGEGPKCAILDTHQLSGARGLWTLRIGVFRGIYQWRLDEAKFIRFGHRSSVYLRLPKLIFNQVAGHQARLRPAAQSYSNARWKSSISAAQVSRRGAAGNLNLWGQARYLDTQA
jgi:mRNA-degrading endonuclease RelE of RelBE toxin-antitoxin system